jgi:hypothetical protein
MVFAMVAGPLAVRARAAEPEKPPAAEGEPPPRGTPPANATQALDRAAAAYEFGDIQQMVDLSRLVAEGLLRGDDDQRADALRLLGIGLYLSGRHDGAQGAFVDLLKLRPRARLDPAITRPEVVAFFEDVKRQNRPKKYLALALLPPFGQFQNGHNVKGWVFLGLEAVTLAAAASTRFWLYRNVSETNECKGHPTSTCESVRTWNHISTAALVGTWVVGISDALYNFHRGSDEPDGRVSFAVYPGGGALRVSF